MLFADELVSINCFDKPGKIRASIDQYSNSGIKPSDLLCPQKSVATQYSNPSAKKS